MENRQYLNSPRIYNIVDRIRKTPYDRSANLSMYDRVHFWVMLKSVQDFIDD